MREMVSEISTSPQRLVRTVTETVKVAQKQQVAQAAPEVAMAGVPSEPDYKKGVTETFKNIVPVHRNVGNAVVGTIAYRTNELAWRDYNPGFFDGINAPEGEYSSKPFYYTNLKAAALALEADPTDKSLIKKAGPEELPVYGTAVTPNKSQARPFTTRIVQGTDTF